MRRLLLLMALCMALALAFAPVAMAQGVPPGGGGGALCPDEAPFVATLAGDPGEASARCFPSQEEADAYRATGSASADATASPTATASPSADVVEIAPGGPCVTPGIAEDVVGVPIEDLPNAYLNRNDPVGTPISSPLDPDGNGIACDDGGSISATATASASAGTVEALPETGGPNPAAFALSSLALLVAGGIFAARIMRR